MTFTQRIAIFTSDGGVFVNEDHIVKQRVQKQFSKAAQEYVVSEIHSKEDDLIRLVEWLSPQPHWTVLDVATGAGHTAKALSPHVNTVIAVDLTKTMLETARTFLRDGGCKNVEYVLADAESLPFLDATFDAVTCRIAAHHFPHPETFIQETVRVLKPGGSFLFIDNIAPADEKLADFMNTFERLRDPSHVRCLSMSEWESWMTPAGLVIKNSQTRHKQYQFPKWVRRMAQSEQQINVVENYILSAALPVQGYFGVTVLGGHVQSLHVDEWMTLCKKTER